MFNVSLWAFVEFCINCCGLWRSRTFRNISLLWVSCFIKIYGHSWICNEQTNHKAQRFAWTVEGWSSAARGITKHWFNYAFVIIRITTFLSDSISRYSLCLTTDWSNRLIVVIGDGEWMSTERCFRNWSAVRPDVTQFLDNINIESVNKLNSTFCENFLLVVSTHELLRWQDVSDKLIYVINWSLTNFILVSRPHEWLS